MNFFIKQNSTLPIIKLKIFRDGRTSFKDFNNLLTGSTITFSLKDVKNDTYRVIDDKAHLEVVNTGDGYEYYVYYQLTKRLTKKVNSYIGEFKITNVQGELILPVRNELIINVIESFSLTDLCCKPNKSEIPASPLPLPTPTSTPIPSVTPTLSSTPQITSTPTNTPQVTSTPTPTNTPQVTSTPTPTSTPSTNFFIECVSIVKNFILTCASTIFNPNIECESNEFNPDIDCESNIIHPTPTETPTNTPTNTETPTPTPTITNTPTNTETPTPTPSITPSQNFNPEGINTVFIYFPIKP